jgi:predicted nucleic acid-binding protein
MADRVVIDASIAIPLVVDESGTQPARERVSSWADSGTELLVPSHFWLEVTNVLLRRYRRSAAGAIEDLIVLDGLGLRTLEPGRPVLLLAIDAMERFGLSAYDAIYVALAQSTDARLATLDRRMADTASQVGLHVETNDPSQIREGPAAYASDAPIPATWMRSAVIGQHIADLRKRLVMRES